MGYLLARYFPDARGSGVPQTKAALFARDGYISLRTVIGKFVCTATTLASGIPLGREGPSVQVGAGIASVLGRRLGLRPEKVKALFPVGAAAAVAAAFNTPMAAVLFSLEEVMGDLNAPILGSVVLASATSWAILRLLLGNNPLFHVPQYELVHPASLPSMRCWESPADFCLRPLPSFCWECARAFCCCQERLAGGIRWRAVCWLGSWAGSCPGAGSWVQLRGRCAEQSHGLEVDGAAGGAETFWRDRELRFGQCRRHFWSCLFLGAMLGGTVGSVAHHFFPAYTALPGAYALVGMGALFAGIVRAPMTSVLMIFEMTHDYAVIVPLMIANLASLFISRGCRSSLFMKRWRTRMAFTCRTRNRSGFGQRKVSGNAKCHGIVDRTNGVQ